MCEDDEGFGRELSEAMIPLMNLLSNFLPPEASQTWAVRTQFMGETRELFL